MTETKTDSFLNFVISKFDCGISGHCTGVDDSNKTESNRLCGNGFNCCTTITTTASLCIAKHVNNIKLVAAKNMGSSDNSNVKNVQSDATENCKNDEIGALPSSLPEDEETTIAEEIIIDDEAKLSKSIPLSAFFNRSIKNFRRKKQKSKSGGGIKQSVYKDNKKTDSSNWADNNADVTHKSGYNSQEFNRQNLTFHSLSQPRKKEEKQQRHYHVLQITRSIIEIVYHDSYNARLSKRGSTGILQRLSLKKQKKQEKQLLPASRNKRRWWRRQQNKHSRVGPSTKINDEIVCNGGGLQQADEDARTENNTPKTQNTVSSFSECHEMDEQQISNAIIIHPEKREKGGCFNFGNESSSSSRHDEDEFSQSNVKRIQFTEDVPDLFVLDTDKRRYCVC